MEHAAPARQLRVARVTSDRRRAMLHRRSCRNFCQFHWFLGFGGPLSGQQSRKFSIRLRDGVMRALPVCVSTRALAAPRALATLQLVPKVLGVCKANEKERERERER